MIDALKINFLPRCLATGIGSLPFVDPEAALDLIFSELPVMPHWPQLPRRGEREHFVHQFLQPLLDCGMLAVENGRWILDASGENSAACLRKQVKANASGHTCRLPRPPPASMPFWPVEGPAN